MIPADSQEAAQAAGLRYISDTAPGITRRRAGRGFAYQLSDGRPARDRALLERIRSLGIPPAWTDVWICPSPHGHIQATGRDARGRKQYRYHPRWRAARDAHKYDRMLEFAAVLPALRARVEHDLGLPGLPRDKVLATVIRLLEATLIRVGNREYARANRSFGLTTLRSRHVDVSGAQIRFEFRGKSGKQHTITARDRRVARIVRSCQELPGQELFQYLDEQGQRQTVDSSDVNGYLHSVTGAAFTAKDFRTWAGSVLATSFLREGGPAGSEAEGRRQIAETIRQVAQALGNTPAICRACYVHPRILEMYTDGRLFSVSKQRVGAARAGLSTEEAFMVAALRAS